MNYSKINADDIENNIINLFKIADYEISQCTIILHLKSGTLRKLKYENLEKARIKYNYFLKLENKERKKIKKERKRIQAIDDLIYC